MKRKTSAAEAVHELAERDVLEEIRRRNEGSTDVAVQAHHLLNASFLRLLTENGWAKMNVGSNNPDVLCTVLATLASTLDASAGYEPSRIDSITPRRRDSARRNSLSAYYGLDQLPLHCDTSHWPTPCRFVLLACVNPGGVGTPTLLLDTSAMTLSPAQRNMAASSVFLIRNGRQSFYSSILSSRRPYIRLDPGCMVPLDPDGVSVMSLYGYENNQRNIREINWTEGDILLIDNWRVLHGRQSCKSDQDERKLLRVIVQ